MLDQVLQASYVIGLVLLGGIGGVCVTIMFLSGRDLLKTEEDNDSNL